MLSWPFWAIYAALWLLLAAAALAPPAAAFWRALRRLSGREW